jgi:hypothetical protein
MSNKDSWKEVSGKDFPSIEIMQEYLLDIWENYVPPKKGRDLMYLRGCKTYGWISSEKDPTYCSDPECSSCSYFRDELSKSLITLPTKQLRKYEEDHARNRMAHTQKLIKARLESNSKDLKKESI